MPTSNEWSNRTVLVTGSAGPGLGGACVRRFARAGAAVVVGDVSSRRVTQSVGVLVEAGHDEARVMGVQLDVSDETSVGTAVAGVLERFGRLDVLVNNAAVVDEVAVVDMPLERWQRVVDTALTGSFLMMRACLPSMYERGSGVVVNIGSVDAWKGSETTMSAYVAAKAGLLGLTRAAADEAGPHGVRVNAVAPGLMLNPIVEEVFPADKLADVVRRTPLARPGRPEDVAEAVFFLASDAASFITGDVITVAGGLYHHA